MTQITDPKMQRCIDACSRCHQTCLREAMNRCLESGGKHIEAEHFRLMMSCAEICQTAANFMLGSWPHSNQICQVCAEICDTCAQSCEQVGGMEDCAKICRECAESCRQMAGTGDNQSTGTKALSPSEEL